MGEGWAVGEGGEGAGSNSRLPSGRGAGSGPKSAPKLLLLAVGLVLNGAGGGGRTRRVGVEQSCLRTCPKPCVRQSPQPRWGCTL